MDGALGFNTFEKQDKVLVGLNGGMDATVTVRILHCLLYTSDAADD